MKKKVKFKLFGKLLTATVTVNNGETIYDKLEKATLDSLEIVEVSDLPDNSVNDIFDKFFKKK